MAGISRLRTIAIVWMLLIGLGGVFWGLWLKKLEKETSRELHQVREAEQILLRVEIALWIQEMRLRSLLLERLGGQPLPPALLRHVDIKEVLKSLEASLSHGRQIPLFRELVERLLLLEKRHTGWRRALEKSEEKTDYFIVFEQYQMENPALIAAAETAIQRFHEYLKKESSLIQAVYDQQTQKAKLYGAVILGGIGLIGIIALLLIGRKESKQLRQIMEAAARGEKIPSYEGPLNLFVQSYNQLLHRWHATFTTLEALAEKKTPSLSSEYLSSAGPAAPLLEGIFSFQRQQEQNIQKLTEENRKLLQQLEAAEKHFTEQVEALRLEIGALQNIVPLAEIAPDESFSFKNDLFLQLPFAGEVKNLSELGLELKTYFDKGEAAQGKVSVQGETYLYFFLPYRKGKSRKGLLSLIRFPDLTQKVQELERALAMAQRRLEEVESSLSRLRQQYSHLQVEYTQEVERLLRQRQTLQTLLKMPALQKGDVIEGLSAICEVAATLDPEARYSFWVFGENQDSLHCLEAYDPSLLTHSNSLDLPLEAAQWVRKHLSSSPGPHLPEVPALQTYLKQHHSHALWMFPIFLDEEHTGVFFVERFSEAPLRDTEYLALLARVASLLLQQGHRKLVEQELLSYLNQAQALEEELRQNIEELEASAEEMRRTQAELRGQITAINAAALVAEMNPEGRIIYVNDPFLRLFGATTEDLLGLPYKQLRRSEEENVVNLLFERLKAGEIWQEVVSYRTRYGDEIWLQQTITPVRQADGQIYKYILIAFDITLQKQQEAEIQGALMLAREQEQLLRENTEELRRSNENYRASQMRLSAQLEALNNAAWLFETDGEGNITYASQSLLEALGYPPEEILNVHYGKLFSDRQPLVLLQGHWRSMLSGQIWKAEVELTGALRQSYWAIMSSTPVLDRSRSDKRPILLKTINVLFDITEQKEQEFRLKEQQNALSLLAAHSALREGNVEKAFQVIAEIALQTLKAHRVSLWLYEEGNTARCVAVAEKETHSHAVGTVVSRSLYPMYFQSLEREHVIAVVDALSDLRTRELALPLFKPNNVASILDGIIRVGANTVGLISVEQRYTRREWQLDEVNFVRALASSAASVIEEEQQAYARRLQEAYIQLEQQKHELEEAMRDIRESIRYAKRMQKNILPADSLLDKYLGKDNYFIIWRPRDRHGVGGDFYWFSSAGDSYFIVVADGTGHGVPGAFISLIGSILLDQIINKGQVYSPAQILHDLHIGVRQILRQDVEGEETPSRDGMDIALVRYFPGTYKLVYAGANLPLYYIQATELKEIKPDKKSIGGEQLEEERFFTECEIQLEPGDTFFLFTDGVVDQSGGPAGKRFGTKQLKEFLLETLHESSMPRRRALFNIRWKEWKDYSGEGEQVDDVTMWGVRVW
ncbi:MAG: PAS domain-containing protein [Bacteroidia bacterium]|nr:PAS domain-containing protein [Bacteroidia bacterium]MDW8134123.1 PAS domain-containing protein [Bacteroidia bacterium]